MKAFDKVSKLPLNDDALSRRDFLRRGLIYVGGIATVSPVVLLTPGCGKTQFLSLAKQGATMAMPWLEWDREKLVRTAYSWIVDRLDISILKDLQESS